MSYFMVAGGMDTGQRFYRLVAIRQVQRSKSRNKQWYFQCDCGEQTISRVIDVKRGLKRSCGCLRREKAPLNGKTRTHGLYGSSEYNTWARMIQRCTNPNDPAFPRYGGRGITVCEEWRGSFKAFLRDMGLRSHPHLTLERKDNEKGYCKDNCCWADRSQQNRNKDYSSVRRRLIARNISRHPRECGYCGKSFAARPTQRYCSRDCKSTARRTKGEMYIV